jgi:hypothetical protein
VVKIKDLSNLKKLSNKFLDNAGAIAMALGFNTKAIKQSEPCIGKWGVLRQRNMLPTP